MSTQEFGKVRCRSLGADWLVSRRGFRCNFILFTNSNADNTALIDVQHHSPSFYIGDFATEQSHPDRHMLIGLGKNESNRTLFYINVPPEGSIQVGPLFVPRGMRIKASGQGDEVTAAVAHQGLNDDESRGWE